ncbi:MAG: hypothetical protein QXF12_00740 [Candidatus Aenigmatarchaeota archaeon]
MLIIQKSQKNEQFLDNFIKNKLKVINEDINLKNIYNIRMHKSVLTSDIFVLIKKTDLEIKILIKEQKKDISIVLTITPKSEPKISFDSKDDTIINIYTIELENNEKIKRSESFVMTTKNLFKIKSENVTDFINKTNENLSYLLKIKKINALLFVNTVIYVMASIKKMTEDNIHNKSGILILEKIYNININII